MTRPARYDEMKDEIAALRASAHSTDQTVTVVAGPGGAIIEIRLSAQAPKAHSVQELNTIIMDTLGRAVADAARQQAEIVQRYLCGSFNIRERVLAIQQDMRLIADDVPRSSHSDSDNW